LGVMTGASGHRISGSGDLLRLASQFNPNDTIVPIFGVSAGADDIGAFLGTGSFVGGRARLLTADHVIRDWPGRFAVTTLADLSKVYIATVLERDPSHDLALLSVEGYRPPRPLVADFDAPMHLNLPLT
jgi:S1-C subfamily serine protease